MRRTNLGPCVRRRGDALARAVAEALEHRRLLATFAVTSDADAGAGTLREAMHNAAVSTAADTIELQLAGGTAAAPRRIVLSDALPTLSLDAIRPGNGF